MPPDVVIVRPVQQVRDPRMLTIRPCRIPPAASAARSGSPDVLDVEGRDHHPFRIAQSKPGARLERLGEILGPTSRVIGIGHSVPSARRMSRHTASWSALVKKAGEGGEPAVQQELDVTQLSGREIERWPIARLRLERGGVLGCRPED